MRFHTPRLDASHAAQSRDATPPPEPHSESTLASLLLQACGASSHGLDGAMKILRHGTMQGVLSPHMRLVALISMVKWCKEDRHSFERIQAEMRETERTSDARKLLMQADRLYPHFAESTLTAGLALDSYSA